MIIICPATAADQKRITEVIRAARINPMDLKWSNFIVAVDDSTGEIVGTGQIKGHRDGSRELASIAVVPEYQGRGIARKIIERLLEGATGQLYLTCSSRLGPLYEKFGFRTVEEADMPPYFRRLRRLAGVFEMFAREETLLVMKRNAD